MIMKRVEFIEKVLLVVLKREIHRKDYVISRKVLKSYPNEEVVTFELEGGVNAYVMKILSEHFTICVVDGKICLCGVRGQIPILAALGIKLT